MIAKTKQTLRAFCQDVFLETIWAGRSADARRGYVASVTRWAVYLQGEPTLDHLKPQAFAAFDRWLQMQVATATRKNTIYKLRTLWRAAHNSGLVAAGPPPPVYSQAGLPVPRCEPRKPVALSAMPIAVHDPGQPGTPLRELIEPYSNERGLRRKAKSTVGHRITSLERLLGRPATMGDLNDQTMNAWAAALLQAGLDPETVRGYRGGILSLWRWAYEVERLDHRPGRIRKIKVPGKSPRAWTPEQLQEILQAAGAVRGTMRGGVRRSTFWIAFILAGYYTGLRPGDLNALRFDQIEPDGTVAVTMSKTLDVLICRLPADAMAAIDKLRSPQRERVFGDLLNRQNTSIGLRRILRAHGLPGSVKWLRRTSATAVEAEHPGAAKAHLGHRTHGLAYRNYVDPRQVQRTKPIPPSLAG